MKNPLSRMFGAPPPPAEPAPEPPAVPVVAPIDPLPTDIPGLLRAAGAGDAALRAAAQARIAELLDAGSLDFRTVGERSLVLGLVVEGASTRIRQVAAQTIDAPAELHELLKQTRGKDKNVYKIIKLKCDALRAEQHRELQVASDAESACASLERHGHRIYDAVYVATFEHFAARWRKAESAATPAIEARAVAAIGLCREVIAAHERRLAERAEQESREQARQVSLQQSVLAAEAAAQLRAAETAAAAAAAAGLRDAREAARAEELAAEARLVRSLAGLLGKANAALKEGNTGQASGLRRAIDEKLAQIPPSGAHLLKQVQQLDDKLAALKEWKDFAAAPKRAELIAEMEALIGSPEEPTALAARIKQLHEDWKTISRGIVVAESEIDWKRFRQAADLAYQPCKQYFEGQARIRKDNLEMRRRVLGRLQAFESAQRENPDWKAVAVALREAGREFRRHSPVDRSEGRAVEQQFEASLARLQAGLDAWHAEHEAEKQALIERARALLTKEDGREATDGVKRLQALWKDVGPARRDREQALWNEFRAQCDAVFQRREKAFAAHAVDLDTAKQRAIGLCEEVERIAGLDGAELLDGVRGIAQWRADFGALGEFPRADARKLHDRFERAVARCQTEVQAMRARSQERSMSDLLEAARRIAAYGWAIAVGADSGTCETEKRAAEAFIAAVGQWPKGGPKLLTEAWSRADAAAGLDPAAQEKALRIICVRAEILAASDTPPEDQQLRREYQVQRLMQHMGRPNDGPAEDPDSLAFEWIRVGPAEPGVYRSLLDRLRRGR